MEPVTVDDDVAKKIKARKFGDGVAQALPNELVDLGDWCGEYGRIVEIEIPKKVVDNTEEKRKREAEEQRKADEAWRKLPPEKKAERDVFFEVAYCTRRLGQIKCDIPEEDIKRGYDTRIAYFTANPTADRMPLSEYPEDLVPPKGKSARGILSEKMRVTPEDPLAF